MMQEETIAREFYEAVRRYEVQHGLPLGELLPTWAGADAHIRAAFTAAVQDLLDRSVIARPRSGPWYPKMRVN